MTAMSTTTTMTTTATHGAVTTNGATAGSTLELVERARASLLEACHSRAVADRYLQSRLAALLAQADRPAG